MDTSGPFFFFGFPVFSLPIAPIGAKFQQPSPLFHWSGWASPETRAMVLTCWKEYGQSRLTNVWLVGGWATPLKNMKVNWDDYKPNIWENKIDVPNHQPVWSLRIISTRRSLSWNHAQYKGLPKKIEKVESYSRDVLENRQREGPCKKKNRSSKSMCTKQLSKSLLNSWFS